MTFLPFFFPEEFLSSLQPSCGSFLWKGSEKEFSIKDSDCHMHYIPLDFRMKSYNGETEYSYAIWADS